MTTYRHIKTGQTYTLETQAARDRFFDNRDPRDYEEQTAEQQLVEGLKQ